MMRNTRQGERGPIRVMLSRRMFADVPAVFFDPDVHQGSNIEDYRGEYMRVRGRVNTWTTRHNGRSQRQLLVKLASKVSLPTHTAPAGSGRPETEEDEP